MRFEFNAEILDKVDDLTPVELFVMYMVFHQIPQFDITKYSVTCSKLQSKGYAKIAGRTLILRKKALSLLASTTQLREAEVSKWIQEWRDIFPPGLNAGGYRYRGDKHECIIKMRKFVVKHPNITKEEIFEATKGYVQRFATKGYNYMMMAHYFIQKQGVGSTLNSEIEGLAETQKLSEEKEAYGKGEL